jgi:hypothetical protein
VLWLAVLGCDRRAATATATATATAAAAATATATAAAATATATGGASVTGDRDARAVGRGAACGELGCAQYGSAAEAFLDVLVGDPLIVGVGEAHAPKGATVPSAARRFTDELLPTLAGRASDLLLELMMPPGGCADAATEVRAKQSVVTSRQAETNQSEYVTMGDRARALGIVPDLLRPSCADLDAMRASSEEALGVMLETIARLTSKQAKRLVLRDAHSDADRDKMVVIYGGALHNDLAPRPEVARWSYAPELDAFSQRRFISIDLVVPEFIGDDETWRSFAWRQYYNPERLGSKTTVFRAGDRSFVLIFARTSHP